MNDTGTVQNRWEISVRKDLTTMSELPVGRMGDVTSVWCSRPCGWHETTLESANLGTLTGPTAGVGDDPPLIL